MASWTNGRPSSSQVTPALRRRVFLAYGLDCYICEYPATEVDHITPWSFGGTTSLLNLRPICPTCHRQKSEAEKQAGIQRRESRKRRPQEPHPSDG